MKLVGLPGPSSQQPTQLLPPLTAALLELWGRFADCGSGPSRLPVFSPPTLFWLVTPVPVRNPGNLNIFRQAGRIFETWLLKKGGWGGGVAKIVGHNAVSQTCFHKHFQFCGWEQDRQGTNKRRKWFRFAKKEWYFLNILFCVQRPDSSSWFLNCADVVAISWMWALKFKWIKFM